jgi:hypothetical protein
MRKPTRTERFTDPVRFAKEILGHDTWPMQDAILRSVAANRRTAVKACHASSKTFAAAEAALWWAARYADGKVLVTSPGWLQVRSVIFGELHRFIRNSKFRFPSMANNQTEIRFNENNFILGLSTNEGVRFQGFHSKHALIIIDEAPGLDASLWEAIEGIAAGGMVHLLALGNPVVSSGYFYDCFSRNRASWTTFTINAFSSPNLERISLEQLLEMDDAALDANPWPSLVSRRWVRDKYRDWWNGSAESSPLWQARVLGEFPAQGSNALISLAWLEGARRQAVDNGGKVVVGVDVAGPGKDETVCAVQCDGAILEMQAWNDPDPRGRIAELLNRYRSRLKTVRIDAIGLGYGIALSLQDQKFPIEMVNVGAGSSAPDRFLNLRAELYWDLKDQFKAGQITGLLDDKALSQLSGLNYALNPLGKIQMQSKAEMAKSPDRADSLMLALARSGTDMSAWIARFYSPEAMAAQRNAASAAPEPVQNREMNQLWAGYGAPPPPKWQQKCRHCPKPIGENDSYRQESFGPFSDGTVYSHEACAQRALAGL